MQQAGVRVSSSRLTLFSGCLQNLSPRKGWALVRLGFARTLYGVRAWAGLGLALFPVLALIACTEFRISIHEVFAIDELMSWVAKLLAWGPGLLFTVSSADRALTRDEREGLFLLAALRGASKYAYIGARTSALAAWVVLIVGGGTLLYTVAEFFLSKAVWALENGQSLVANGIYILVFSFVVSCFAMAVLGPNRQRGGVWIFFSLLLFPTLGAFLLQGLLPTAWIEVVSIPGALSALHEALQPPGIDFLQAVRAVFALTLMIGIAHTVACYRTPWVGGGKR